jgi:hypothetical protein
MPALLAAVAIQAPARPGGWEHFPVFVWTTSDKPLELVAKFGGACVQRQEDPAWLDDRKLDWFLFNAPGRDDLHLDRENPAYQARWRKWYDTRDPELLVREPCLLQSATLERMKATLDKSLAALATRHCLGVSLGDEVGLTPGGGPEDVCQCATCEQAWTAWWPARVHDATRKLPALREITTEATIKALAEGDTASIGPWLLRRHFHQDSLLGALDGLAKEVHAKSPGMGVGLLGIGGQTAFDGVAIERVLPALDFFECYRVGDARELALTLRRPEQRALLTIFRDQRGPDFAAWQAWEHWMRGGDGLVIWSESDLRKSQAYCDRLERAVRDIRDVESKIGRFLPRPEGVALVHSADSLAVSWLREALGDGATWPKRFPSYQEEHGAFEAARKHWLEFLEDVGLMPGVLPLDQIDAATVKRFPRLVVDPLLVLDDADGARLKQYVGAGGNLIRGDEFGWIDSAGTTRSRKAQNEWLATVAPTCSRPMPAWDSRKLGPKLRDDASKWMRDVGLQAAPFSIGGDSGEHWCWIQTWMHSGDGFVCAALPKPYRYEDEQTSLTLPGTIEVSARDEKLRVEWVHPAPDEHGVVRLPPCDAAVFRLVPRK